MNWLAKIFAFLWKKAGTVDPATGKTLFEELLALAIQIAEPMKDIDLNRDGKVAAWNEVSEIAVELGIRKLKRLLTAASLELIDEAELLRWLGIARLIKLLAERLGIDRIPQWRVIAPIFDQAYAVVTADAIRADLEAKGLV